MHIKDKKLTLLLLVILTALTAFFIFTSMSRMNEMTAVPPENVAAEKEGEASRYAIPENRIPSIMETKEKIPGKEAHKAAKEGTAVKMHEELPPAETTLPVEETVAQEPPKPAAKTGKAALPEKTEVRFPTFRERQKLQGHSTIVAY
jgi:hypothetical protein